MIVLHRKICADGSERFAFFHTSVDLYGDRSFTLAEVRDEIAAITTVEPDDWIERSRRGGSNAETVVDWYAEPTIAECGGHDYSAMRRPDRLDGGDA